MPDSVVAGSFTGTGAGAAGAAGAGAGAGKGAGSGSSPGVGAPGKGGKGRPSPGIGSGEGRLPGGGKFGVGKGASDFLDFLPLRRPTGLTSSQGMGNHP